MFRVMWLMVVIVSLVLVGCGKQAHDVDHDGLRVVTTIGMITDIVERIGGDRIRVSGLMGPGVDPHLYKASEGDVSRMSRADIIFYNGLHLEGALTEVLGQMNRRVKTVAVTDGIDPSQLLSPEDYEGNYDPHVWFDVSMWMQAVRHITETLVQVDSAGKNHYETRSGELLQELKTLHEYVRQQADRIPERQRVLITAHDAFNYFGRAYGFEVRGLQGISTAAEAGTGDVQSLVNFIVERRIPAIFIESSVPPRNIEAVQAAVKSRRFDVQIGGELFSDAMGSEGTPEGSYTGMVRYNIDTIVRALLKKSEGEQKY